MSLRRKAAITGIGEIRPGRVRDGRTIMDVWVDVSRRAMLDAELMPSDIDGLLVGQPFTEAATTWPLIIGEYLQIRPTYGDAVALGGASACAMVWRAAAAIDAGLCSTVLCITGETFGASFSGRSRRPAQQPQLPHQEYELPYGPHGANSSYAMIAMRHMHEFNTTSRQLAKIAVDQRTNACANPDAVFYGQPLSVDDVLESPIVTDPLHLLEIVMPCVGGAAVVVASPERARGSPHPPAWLLGAGEHSTVSMVSQIHDLTTSPIAVSAPRAFQMAGVTPKDIDLISVYYCYTIMVLMTLEDAGFCPKGRGGPYVEEHDLTFGGDLPLNTHGGQLSFGQPGLAGGMSHVTEAVRQLQGRAGDRQLRDCELAFVNGNSGSMTEEVSLVLGR